MQLDAQQWSEPRWPRLLLLPVEPGDVGLQPGHIGLQAGHTGLQPGGVGVEVRLGGGGGGRTGGGREGREWRVAGGGGGRGPRAVDWGAGGGGRGAPFGVSPAVGADREAHDVNVRLAALFATAPPGGSKGADVGDSGPVVSHRSVTAVSGSTPPLAGICASVALLRGCELR